MIRPPASSMIGQTISHYRVVERLGGGGMGVVYKAVDTRLNRTVALKFLSADQMGDADAAARFRQEAQAASALDHPNICTVFEIDEAPEGQTFIAMAHYDGETLKQRIERGPLPVVDAVGIARQIAQGLAKAHAAGIVHRDIKPANLIVTIDGIVKILDFGIAKAPGQEELTRTGTTLGTLSYMAPEQVSGAGADHRVDLWALGAVLHEMLAGHPPFGRDDPTAVVSAILARDPTPLEGVRADVPEALQQVVLRALRKPRDDRYQHASEIERDLAAVATALAAPVTVGRDARPRWSPLRRWGVAAALMLAAAAGLWAWTTSSNARRAREELIPQATRLANEGHYAAAFTIAARAEQLVPNNPSLQALWPSISAHATLRTTPDGAEVFFREYGKTDGEWQRVGTTPLERVRLPQGLFEWRIEHAAAEQMVLVARLPGPMLTDMFNLGIPTIALAPKGTQPAGMTLVPGGSRIVSIVGFPATFVTLAPYFIDRYEVTNREFKEFLDAGGYRDDRYWAELPFLRAGRSLSWKDAVADFVDRTGRPGPSTWELGDYPAGQEDHPVGGVSWFEAVAYARFRGKTLPSITHWAHASASLDATFAIANLSNFSNREPARVGSYAGMGPFGSFDTAGNLREWVWNASGDERWILGGAWNEPSYVGTVPRSLSPFDRSAVNGFRCAIYPAGTVVADALMAPRPIVPEDHRTAKPVSDEAYQILAKQFAYEPGPLNARVEWTNDTHRDYVRQRITFDAGYDDERTPLHLFLPRNAQPPFRTVVFSPGSAAFMNPGSSDERMETSLDPHEFVYKSGFALAYPVYDGSFERWRPVPDLTGAELLRHERIGAAHRRQDLGRTIDYLETRQDIQSDRLFYLGFSRGAAAIVHVALEPRLKGAILLSGGVTRLPPEFYAPNYAPRLTIPVLMLNGRYDHIFPVETAQIPLFAFLGTPPAHKRHVIYDAGHFPLPRNEWIPEALAWLEKYLPATPPSTPR
jgi:predicted esterase